MAERVLIVGGGFAGLNCALSLDSGDFDVVLFDDTGEHVFRPGLVELIRGRFDRESLVLDLEDFLSDTGIEFVCESVEGVSPEVKNVEAGGETFDYDYLVVAAGSERFEPGFSLRYAEDFYSIDATEEAVEKFEEGEEVIVIGSGYTGVEVAGELDAAGLDVQVVDGSTRPMPSSPEKASHSVLDYFNERGISFMGGREVSVVTSYGVELEDGSEVEADHVVWCGGLEASEISRVSFGSGRSGIDTNSGLSALEYEDVFVAGDSAGSGFLKTAQNAEKQGIHVARNISSSDEILQEFDPGVSPLVVSLGDSGMMIIGEKVVESRLLRYLKGMILRFYFLNVRRRKLSSGFIDSVKSSFSVVDIMGK